MSTEKMCLMTNSESRSEGGSLDGLEQPLESARQAKRLRAALVRDAQLAQQAAAGFQSVAENFRNVTRQLATAASSAAQALLEQQEQIRVSVEGVLERWNRALPPNWPADRWREAFDLVRDTNWALVWVPRTEIVCELIDASTAADRDRVLLERADDIADDCTAHLQNITATSYEELARFALEASAAFRGGHAAAGQALAAGIVTTVIQHNLGYDRLADAALALAVDPANVAFDAMRIALITSCVPDTLSSFWPGDPVPTSFNRHASSHRVSNEQYTRRNAVVSLIMVSALLRELHDLEATGRWSP